MNKKGDSMTAEQALAEALDRGFPHGWMRGKFNSPAWEKAAELVLAALPQGWSLTATPPGSDAQATPEEMTAFNRGVKFGVKFDKQALKEQVAVLREALTDVLEYMARDYPSDSIDFSDAWRVLADTEATAKAYRDEVVKPWRAALWHKQNRHRWFEPYCEDCHKARALLSNTESAP